MMILSHTLVVPGDGDDAWEIEHPDGCWVDVPDWDGVTILYRDTDCVVSGKINWDPRATEGFDALPPGRYALHYRHEGESDRFDDWLMIGCGALPDHGPHEGCPGEGPFRAVRS
jgi:hypothetical protein